MDSPSLVCTSRGRRQAVCRASRNGIDAVEVPDPRQMTDLRVHLFRDAPADLTAANVRIDGGRRVRDIQVLRAWVDPSSPSSVRVIVDRPGDFSPYTLRLVAARDGRPTETSLETFDPRFAGASFSFRTACPSDADCKDERACPADVPAPPAISYLAKDYATFRQLMLDRLSLTMPDWRERHVPDVGIVLVELLAYAADHLSYEQDAVATEAYLDTARERISVRRHTRLVDYRLHEGCNARTWIAITTDTDLDDPDLQWKDVFFTTAVGALPPVIFEPLQPAGTTPIELYEAHNSIGVYAWGDTECCLPMGATVATLRDGWTVEDDAPVRRLRHLKPGDYLLFEEVIGPKTGNPADADPRHRQVVRLISVRDSEDPLFTTTAGDEERPQPVVEVAWAVEDALTFPLCVSVRLPAPDCTLVDDVSVARGNVILVDHGAQAGPQDLGTVGVAEEVGECECGDAMVEVSRVAARFGPVLEGVPLTFAAPVAPELPASRALAQDPRLASAGIVSLTSVAEDGPAWRWEVREELLSSGAGDRHVVVEIDDDGRAHLRFGDGDSGRAPEPSSAFTVLYRVGNGPAGNIGADTVTGIGWRGKSVSGANLRCRNPLPASGGRAAETLAEARLAAPGSIATTIERAITADDYAALARRDPEGRVQGAGAALRWTGSWYAAQVAIDPTGTDLPVEPLIDGIARRLRPYRRIGHDLDVRQATYVPMAIELQICVLPSYVRGQVEAALRDAFGAGVAASGRPGVFHPDRLTFGQAITSSRLIADAQSVPGVASARVLRLERLGEGDRGEVAAGILQLAPLEVPQLGQDPSLPERGTLMLRMEGGR